MKKKGLIVIAVVVTMVAASGSAFAWGHGKGIRNGNCPGWEDSDFSGRGAGRQGSPWANLSKDQRDQLRALHQSFVDDTAETRIKMNAKREEMRIILGTSEPDQTRLNRLNKELGELRTQVMERRLAMIVEAKKIAPELKMGRGLPGFGRHHRGKGFMD